MIKRFVLFFSILILILLKINNVTAVSISNTTITGMNSKNVGETLSLSFTINFNGIENVNENSLGIWLVGYEIIFDKEVFGITDISSPDFDSTIYMQDGKYYVLSEVDEDATSKNMCSNGVLYCGDYLATIGFFIKNTEKTSSTIKMGEIEVGLLDMVDSEKVYTLDDLIEINSISNYNYVIEINNSK